VPRAEQAPRSAPVQATPPPAPVAESSAAESRPAAQPKRADPVKPRAQKKVAADEKKGHPDPRER
jgi:hypothetical protein